MTKWKEEENLTLLPLPLAVLTKATRITYLVI
jgi:hypothetical protein